MKVVIWSFRNGILLICNWILQNRFFRFVMVRCFWCWRFGHLADKRQSEKIGHGAMINLTKISALRAIITIVLNMFMPDMLKLNNIQIYHNQRDKLQCAIKEMIKIMTIKCYRISRGSKCLLHNIGGLCKQLSKMFYVPHIMLLFWSNRCWIPILLMVSWVSLNKKFLNVMEIQRFAKNVRKKWWTFANDSEGT